MNNQEAFNKIWEHFVTNKQPRSLRRGYCSYRGDNGTKCAVGVLIPDSLYDFSAETAGIFFQLTELKRLLKTKPVFRRWFQGPLRGVSFKFLRAVQYAHDTSVDRPIETVLLEIAQRFNLQIPIEVKKEETANAVC